MKIHPNDLLLVVAAALVIMVPSMTLHIFFGWTVFILLFYASLAILIGTAIAFFATTLLWRRP